MRDRLIELLDDLGVITNVPINVDEDGCGTYEIEDSEYIADRLIENGVIVPPVKIGQELWDIHYNKPRKWEVVYLGYNGKEWYINIHWWKDRHNFKTLQITYPFLGKMFYFTKEEAEKSPRGEGE